MKNGKITFFFERKHYIPRTGDDIKDEKMKENKKDLYNAILKVQPSLYLEIISNGGKLLVDDGRVRIYKYIGLKQCFKCLEFGHTSKKCNDILKGENIVKCSHCSLEHELENCTKRGKRTNCISCVKSNMK